MYRPTVRFTLGEATVTTPYQSKSAVSPTCQKMLNTHITPRKSIR